MALIPLNRIKKAVTVNGAPRQQRCITIPVDIDAKMSTYPNVNWSEVATAAFGHKLKDLELLTGCPEEDLVVIERLAAERNNRDLRQKAAGMKAGMEFLAEHGSYDELESLFHRMDNDDTMFDFDFESESYMSVMCRCFGPAHNMAWFEEKWGRDVHWGAWGLGFLEVMRKRGAVIMQAVYAVSTKA